MSDEQALKNAVDALGKAMELNRQIMESNRQTMEMANRLISSFSGAAANLKEAAEKLEVLLQPHHEEPVVQASRTKFSPTHEVSNDGDEILEMPVSDSSSDTYLVYNYAASGMTRSRDEYDRLYEACLESRKEAEFHAMILQLAQNMAALKQYEYSDEVYEAEQKILDALYDEDEAWDAMDEGKKYRGGLQADWDSLLENLKKALGICEPEDVDAGEE